MKITWSIQNLACSPRHGEMENVVITADWHASATEGNHGATAYGSTSFTAPAPEDFKPFEELTEEDVLRWTFQKIDKSDIELGLVNQIAGQINPSIVNLPLPWVPLPQVQEPAPEVVEEPVVAETPAPEPEAVVETVLEPEAPAEPLPVE